MPSTTVFTGVIAAFYALLRYIELLFAIFPGGRGDLESGPHPDGVATSDSQGTDSSSFHCQGLDESFVYTGPFLPSPQATSSPRRANPDPLLSSHRGLRMDDDQETGDIGQLFLVSIEPQTCSPVICDSPKEVATVLGPNARTTVLRATNPDEYDGTPPAGEEYIQSINGGSIIASPCPSLLDTPASSSTAWTGPPTPHLAQEIESIQSQPVTKSTSLAEKRGYTKFIKLNSIAMNAGTHSSTVKCRNGNDATSGRDTPFSEIGTSTPLPRYTPTDTEFQPPNNMRMHGRSASSQAQARAPSYFRSRPTPSRAVRRNVVFCYVTAQTATTSTCEPLMSTLGSLTLNAEELVESQPSSSPTALEPVDALVAEVLSRLRIEVPMLGNTAGVALRPLILPRELENRTTSDPTNTQATATRPLLLPRQVADRIALGSSTDQQPDGGVTTPTQCGSSADDMSIYSQASWQEGSPCTVRNKRNFEAFEEAGLHVALGSQGVSSRSHKRRAICMPNVNVPQRS
ncbi:hypothetical protein BC835DRAFT_1419167 [Cytidiella melzeri]|nr:hypothetical protein BC835DRAFT_1419167 [Cytidiella melzeri]